MFYIGPNGVNFILAMAPPGMIYIGPMTYQVPGMYQQPLVRTWALPASSIYNEGFGGNVRYYRNQYEYHQYHT